MDELLLRHGNIEKREALHISGAYRVHVAERVVDHDNQVGVLDVRKEGRVGADADFSSVAFQPMVDDVPPAEGRDDRHAAVLRKSLDVVACLFSPAGAANNDDRPLRDREHGADLFHVGRGGHPNGGSRIGLSFSDDTFLLKHVFRHHEDDGPHSAGHGRMVGALDEFRDAPRIIDLGHPFCHGRKHRAEIVGHERFALHQPALHLAYHQDHGRRILVGRMHAVDGVGGARAARDKRNARAPGQFAVGLRHLGGAVFVAAGDGTDFRMTARQGIQHGKKTLARDVVDEFDPVEPEFVSEDFAAFPLDHLCTFSWPDFDLVRSSTDDKGVFDLLGR